MNVVNLISQPVNQPEVKTRQDKSQNNQTAFSSSETAPNFTTALGGAMAVVHSSFHRKMEKDKQDRIKPNKDLLKSPTDAIIEDFVKRMRRLNK